MSQIKFKLEILITSFSQTKYKRFKQTMKLYLSSLIYFINN